MCAASGVVPAQPTLVTPAVKTFGVALKGIGLHPGNETQLLARGGGGTITLMWFTGELIWPTFGDTRIRVYVDGEAVPSLDFKVLFAVGQRGATLSPWGERRLGNVALSGGVYMTFRVPFSQGIRVTAQLPEHEVIGGSKSLYFIARGLTGLPVTLGPLQLPPAARLKLRALENYAAAPLEEVPVYSRPDGAGALLLTAFTGASPHNLTYLEGETRSTLDGEPLLLSSGTEDFFLSGQYFDLGEYHTPLSGCTNIDRLFNFTFAAWKLWEEDPVVWSRDFNMTWRMGEARGIRPGPTNITTYVWAYEW